MEERLINVLSQVLEVSQVEDIQVTATQHDEDAGQYVREIRVYGPPVTVSGARLSFTLRLVSPDRSKLDVTAPEHNF